MRGFLIGAALAVHVALGAFPANGAALHRMTVHPNPSLIILAITEGPDGLLWLAATDGLYRFDGLHYHKITGYPFSSARFVGFTKDGSLWAGDFQGLARMRDGRFEVVLHDDVRSMAAYPDEVYAGIPGGLARITLDDVVHRLPYITRRDLTIDATGFLWAVCTATRPMQACRIDPHHPEQADPVATADYQQVLGTSDGKMWAAHDEEAVLLDHGRIARRLDRNPTQENIRPGPLLAGRDGQIWFLGETIQGLTTPVEFRDHADNQRYPPLAGAEDNQRRLWVASGGRGLVQWTPDLQWQRWFPEDFAKEYAVMTVRDQRGSVVVATRKNLYRLEDEKWTPLLRHEHRFESVLPLDDGFLVTIRDFGIARLSRDGKVLERLKDPSGTPEAYREIVRDARGRLWLGSRRALFRIEGKPGSLHLREEPLPGLLRKTADAVDLELDSNGRLWVGYSAGIAWMDDQDTWHKIATNQPVTLVRSFALAGDNEIWVAYRRPGSFSRLCRAGDVWKVETLADPPIDTHFLKHDSRGWIWRGTPQGVYISDGVHVAPDDWIHLHLGNGLAANETDIYGFFEDSEHSVWIAGEEGVTHLRPEASWFDSVPNAAPPPVTRVEADGQEFLFGTPGALPAGTKSLRIEVGGLQASPFRDAPVRYRLLPAFKDWRTSRTGTLEFRNLPSKLYTLEIAYAGDTSQIGKWQLAIGNAAPGISWLWLILVPLGLSPIFFRSARSNSSWFDKLMFRTQKSIFLWRRRHHRGRFNATSDDHSGETLAGRYRLFRIVSRGGFSVVYEAVDLNERDARIAVKIMNQTIGDSDGSKAGWIRDRFAQEVASLRTVDHPGVVRVLDSWISPAGEPCLAMPFLDGPTLRQAMNRGQIELHRTGQIVRKIAAGLAEVHSHGIVHRDLKPENIVLLNPGTDREQPVILDFGTAGLRGAQDELAATTLMAGSFHYMAPERLTGRYSPASDVFSFAVVVLEMLTGKKLGSLNATFFDNEFCGELATVLATRIRAENSRKAAELLALAFDPEPRRRPVEVQDWAGGIADLIG
jgi:ligand-binding sensor domain-containing protein